MIYVFHLESRQAENNPLPQSSMLTKIALAMPPK